MKNSEWASGILEDFQDNYDFGACQRPDGSIYGTSGQCRKGKPINLSDIKGAKRGQAGKGNPRMAVNQKRLAQLTDNQLQRVLDERSLNPGQRQAIKEELGGRGKVPQSKGTVTAQREKAQRDAKEKGAPSKKVTAKFLREATDSQLREYQLRAPHQYQREKITAELERRKKAAGGSTKASAKKTAEPKKAINEKQAKAEVKKLEGQWDKAKNARLAALRKGDDEKAAKLEAKMKEIRQKQEDLKSGVQTAKGEVSSGLTKGLSPLGQKGYDPQKTYDRADNKELGAGAQGAAYRTKGPPPGVVKKGEIGEFEASAIAKLKGVDGVPELHGQRITGAQKSADGRLGGHVKSATGFIAMGEARGKPVMGITAERKLTPMERGKMMDEYVRLRKDIHLRGVAHNDMHVGNFFYDTKTGKGGLVDFGLAQVSPRAALKEALGLKNPAADFQADRMNRMLQGRQSVKSGRLRRFEANQARAEQRMRELGFNPERNSGIRTNLSSKRDPWKNMTDDQANEVLGILYDGV